MTTSITNVRVNIQPRSKAILCLSGDVTTLRVRRMLLERFGYKVWSTNSVEDVDVIAKANCPDMLLMDNSLPNVNIEQIAERVKTLCPDLVAVALLPFFAVHNASNSAIDRFVARDDAPDLMIAQIQELLRE